VTNESGHVRMASKILCQNLASLKQVAGVFSGVLELDVAARGWWTGCSTITRHGGPGHFDSCVLTRRMNPCRYVANI
jgi:hypothetical protein